MSQPLHLELSRSAWVRPLIVPQVMGSPDPGLPVQRPHGDAIPSFPFPSSGKAPAPRKPPLQPKPVVLTTVPVPPRAGPASTAVLLQPLVQQPTVSPVVLIQGAIRAQPEGPAPAAPRPERKSIVPAPMPGNACPPEVDVRAGEAGQALSREGGERSVLGSSVVKGASVRIRKPRVWAAFAVVLGA